MGTEMAVFSKVPLTNVEFFQYPYESGMLRGAFFFETPSYSFVNTHLDAGDSPDKRRRQFDLLTQRIEELKKERNRNFFILGDLNIDSYTSDDEYQSIIGAHSGYYDPRRGLHQKTESTTNALTNYMRGKEVHSTISEMVDYVLLHGDPEELDLKTQFVETYSIEKPGEALSDHKGLILEIKNLS
jgi:endonuclease/exonuclease/phosphatase family metal-dependent hydrolase